MQTLAASANAEFRVEASTDHVRNAIALNACRIYNPHPQPKQDFKFLMNGGIDDGSACTIADNGDGTKTITCDDGTSVVVTDGATGSQGIAGPSGIDPEELEVTITDVIVTPPGTTPLVSFTLTDHAAEPYSGLSAGSLRWTIAKLVMGQNGDPSQWTSYINKTETPTAGVGNGDGSPREKA